MLVREERPGATEAALDLVEDQGDLPFRAQRAELGEESRIENSNTALALDRLGDHGRGRISAQYGREIVDVTLANRYAAGERAERLAIRGAIGRRQGREQPAVERPAERDDLVLRLSMLAGPFASALERPFLGFRA